MIAKTSGKVTAARICLNAIWIKPYRALKAEKIIMKKELNEKLAEDAGHAAMTYAEPMEHNGYMVQIAKVLVKRSILACAEHK